MSASNIENPALTAQTVFTRRTLHYEPFQKNFEEIMFYDAALQTTTKLNTMRATNAKVPWSARNGSSAGHCRSVAVAT